MMQEFGLAMLVSISGWWFATGLILLLVHRSTAASRQTIFLFASAVMLVSLFLVPVVAARDSATMTVIGFGLGLVIWGWLELGYLLGFVTGLHMAECPRGAPLWTRIRMGIGASLWHELWLLLLVLALFILSQEQPNPMTLWTFAALWIMRWSAKINLVLGVRNYNQDWLPGHLGYLDSYIPRRSFNAFFPISVVLGVAFTIVLFSLAAQSTDVGRGVAYSLTAALIGLGTLEHLFLMFPLGDARLWHWATRPRRATVDGK